MRKEKRKIVIPSLLILALLLVGLVACVDKQESSTSELEKTVIGQLNDELSDVFLYGIVDNWEKVPKEDYLEVTYELHALKTSGKSIILFKSDLPFGCTFFENKIFLWLDEQHSIGMIDLTAGNGNYIYESVVTLPESFSINSVTFIANQLFYAYSIENYHYLGKYDMTGRKNEIKLKEFGWHWLDNLKPIDENHIAYIEFYGNKKVLKILDINNLDEKVLNKYCISSYDKPDGLLYLEQIGKKFIFYEYREGEEKEISSVKLEDWQVDGSLLYQEGLIYLSGDTLYYFDGKKHNRLMTGKSGGYGWEKIGYVSDDTVRIYSYLQDPDDIVINYDYNLTTGKTRKTTSNKYYEAFYFPVLTEKQKSTEIESKEFIGQLTALVSGINYRSKAVVSSQTYLGKLTKNEIYDVYEYEKCDPFKSGEYTVYGWFLVEVAGKKVYVANIPTLLEYQEN